jgi:uncharacterized protein (TIGR03435 family)
MFRTLFAQLFPFVCLTAQIAAPAFELVSIRRVPIPNSPVMRPADFTPVLPHGGYRNTFTTPESLIAFAWNVRDPDRHLTGAPKWAKEWQFSVSAKAPADFPSLGPEENREQVRLMMRRMLTDRFHLRLHTEMRPEKADKLQIAKSGFKLKEVDPPVPPEKEGYTFGAGSRLLGQKTTMARLATALTIMTGRTVVDETGLKGYYTFDISWTVESPSGDDNFATPDFNGFLVSALADRFGLRLTGATVTGEYVVIDRMDPPTEN